MLSVDIYPRHTNISMGDKCTVPSRALFFLFFFICFIILLLLQSWNHLTTLCQSLCVCLHFHNNFKTETAADNSTICACFIPALSLPLYLPNLSLLAHLASRVLEWI